MKSVRTFSRAAALALLALAGCGPSAEQVAPAPPAAQAAQDLDLDRFEGDAYGEIVSAPEMARYDVDALPLGAAARARFARAFSQTAPAWVVEGGGAQGLVIVGCDASACAQAAAVLAIDAATGAAYAAVRDGQGRETLIANDRLEALVEATSPADRWDDPEAWADGNAPE
jgi:hypothetical protein